VILPTRTKSGAQSSRSISWRPRCLALSRDTYVVCPKLNPKASVSCRQGQVTSPVCKACPFAALRKVGEDVRVGAEPILVRRWAPCLGELFRAKIFLHCRSDQRQRFLVSGSKFASRYWANNNSGSQPARISIVASTTANWSLDRLAATPLATSEAVFPI
jgi:hypothetical protein